MASLQSVEFYSVPSSSSSVVCMNHNEANDDDDDDELRAIQCIGLVNSLAMVLRLLLLRLLLLHAILPFFSLATLGE